MTANLNEFLLSRLRLVQQQLGVDPTIEVTARFADVIDSMGFAEFLALVAGDCNVPVERLLEVTGRRFGTVADLVNAMASAGLEPRQQTLVHDERVAAPSGRPLGWIASVSAVLPNAAETATELDRRLDRPSGWLETHAGILQRRVWREQDPLLEAARTARQCLAESGIEPREVGALLVTSEAPPRLLGLAAALHNRIGLSSNAIALEIGGACAGFLSALWTGVRLLSDVKVVLIVALECASRWLHVEPGPAGEAAALFGDGAAACLLTDSARGKVPLPLMDITLAVQEDESLVQLRTNNRGGVDVTLAGAELAARAVNAMADSVLGLCARNGLSLADLSWIVAHAGNGRFPALLARKFGIDVNKIASETSRTGNLGAASLPVAWANLNELPVGPTVWTTVGAGLQWGAALLGSSR